MEWDVKGGSLTLGAFAPIKVSAGKSVTVDNLEAGPKVTIASGDADALEKSGSDMLTINGMPGQTHSRGRRHACRPGTAHGFVAV